MTTDMRPFRAWRYDPARIPDVGAVSAPPYDVVSAEDENALLESSPHNIVRVENPRPTDTQDRYAVAAATWREWTSGGVLLRDRSPAFYLVRHQFRHADREFNRLELVGALRLVPWEDGGVLPHEHTHAEPRRDRLSLIRALNANVSPILAAYADPGGVVRSLLRPVTATEPALNFRGTGGDRYEVWPVTGPALCASIANAFTSPVYIADGHHRYETALEYRDGAPVADTGAGARAIDYVMASLTALDDPGLLSLPYHRLLRGVPQSARDRLERQLTTYFSIREVAIDTLTPDETARIFETQPDTPGEPPIMAIVDDHGRRMRLLWPVSAGVFGGLLTGESDAWGRLSPCVFLDVLVAPGLGTGQQEAEERGWLSYPRDAAEAVSAVRDGGFDSAFLLRAVPMGDMTMAARAGERLPPKSTYFYPKLATGIVMNSLDGNMEPA